MSSLRKDLIYVIEDPIVPNKYYYFSDFDLMFETLIKFNKISKKNNGFIPCLPNTDIKEV